MCVTYDCELDWNAYGAEMVKDFALMTQIAEVEKVQEYENTESKYPPLPYDVKENVCTNA